jgi:hypothetical protein
VDLYSCKSYRPKPYTILIEALNSLSGETATKAVTETVPKQNSLSHPLEITNGELPFQTEIRRRDTLARFGEKKVHETKSISTAFPAPQRRRSLREVPFSKITFQMICKALQVHRSILRSISRSDISSFSCERVKMGTSSIGKQLGSKPSELC